MNNEIEYIEICVGIGLDQFTPEFIKIPVTQEKKKVKKEIEIEIEK